MVNKLNEYFVNVGIELANNIAPSNQHGSVQDYIWSPRTKTVYFSILFLSKTLLQRLIRAKVKHHATLTVLIGK